MKGILLNNICQISEIILIDFGHQSSSKNSWDQQKKIYGEYTCIGIQQSSLSHPLLDPLNKCNHLNLILVNHSGNCFAKAPNTSRSLL